MILALALAAVMQFFAQDNSSAAVHSVGSGDSIKSRAADRYVLIDNIIILGNDITKPEIILRELDVEKGQTINYDDLLVQLKEDEQRVNNLKLFNTVKVQPVELDQDKVLIIVEVTERWYIFPVPLFDLVDRNFNVWWEQHNRDLSRVNYGLKLYQYNFRGRNEKLKLTLQFGYTHKFGLNYSIPYLDKAQKHGLIIAADYTENKNIPYQTEDHIQQFFDSESVLLRSLDLGLNYVYRNNYQSFHYFGLKYLDNQIHDTVTHLNPNYFLNGDTRQQYLRASYVFVRDKRDVQAYPLNGYYLEAGLAQLGLGVFNDLSQTELTLQYAKYFDLKKHWYFSNYSSAYLTTPGQLPYNTYYGVGYKDDAIRGYELYLIEGSSFFLNKSTIKKRLFSIRETISAIPIRQFRHFPLDVYLKTYADWGYVNNFENYGENNRFSDSYLFGTGIGLDLHTMYDMVIRLEYSINKNKETGFFFHFKREF